MGNITAKITPQQRIRSTITGQIIVQARTITLGNLRSLSSMIDVDLTGAEDGALLIYDGTRQKWIATILANNQHTIVDGGSF